MEFETHQTAATFSIADVKIYLELLHDALRRTPIAKDAMARKSKSFSVIISNGSTCSMTIAVFEC